MIFPQYDGCYGTMEERIQGLRRPAGQPQPFEVQAYDKIRAAHPRREIGWPEVARLRRQK